VRIKSKSHPYEWLKTNVEKLSQKVIVELKQMSHLSLTGLLKKSEENILTQRNEKLQSQLVERLKFRKIDNVNLTNDEKDLLNTIKRMTHEANRDNVTRTKAYADFYFEHPEIHWAFLAHMVSRNGGWNMTDLKGDMLPHLLSEKERQDFFKFLERCNWLIFKDAYPQLLLYAESKKRRERLFHLLPYLKVSSFMEVVWNWFWDHSDSKKLAFALIINEQQYIESRVVQQSEYQINVLNQLEFRMQSLLHFNQVSFPYWDAKAKKMKVAGTTVENFKDVKERIKIGKRLYAILFEVQEIQMGVRDWSIKTIHTGSRADYWPHIFTKRKHPLSHQRYKLHLNGKRLHVQAKPLASPTLKDAWPIVENPEPAEDGEWFQDRSIIKELEKPESPEPYELTNEHYFALNKIELAIIAREKLFLK
jgi:hypothetical protein